MPYQTHQQIEDALELLSPPGDTLAETLEAMTLSKSELATRMGRPLKTISEIINGKTAITPETALQLAHVLGIPASFWLERERRFQLEKAEIEEARLMLEQKAWAMQFPTSDLANWLGWPDEVRSDVVALYKNLLSFFGVAKKEVFDENYLNKLSIVAFKKSESSPCNEYAAAAWLRMAELEIEQQPDWPEYDKKKLEKILPQLKKLMAEAPADFFAQAKQHCKEAGVHLIATPLLPNVPINGCARVFRKRRIIQLSDRYKRYDILWFTLFHEIAHILMHADRHQLMIDLQGGTDDTNLIEKEANDFAINWTFSVEQEAELIASLRTPNPPLTQIEAYAQQVGTHASLIIGRLRRTGRVNQQYGDQYMAKVEITK